MLSLLRLIFFLGLIGAAVYGALFVLADVVEPPSQEITVPVPTEKFNK